ncbi:MAG: hypothetical protein JSR80_00250 [Verrucomicrobia bacterium]|nr:hypothetical protein [Verrucomicrobiota bacterium]
MKHSVVFFSVVLLAIAVVADETSSLEYNAFKVEGIQDLNSRAAAWEEDPYYAAVHEESLDQIELGM